jgi:poly(3-hydroxybutyrate) depolymerase
VVLSSYQSRSDTNEIGTLRALQALLGEALHRFAIDRKRIYLAGLSGTAKTLWTRTDALAPCWPA